MKMYVEVIYSTHSPEKLQIEKTIQIVNKLQTEYRLTAVSSSPDEYDFLFQEEYIDFSLCADKLQKNGYQHRIYIVDTPFDDNWFSHEERMYSIITTDSWNELFAPPSVKSYLLYQFAQSLLNFTAGICEGNALGQLFHYETTGCANDMCMNKSDIKISIAAGFICPSCRVTFMQYGLYESQLQAIESILNAARLEAIAKPLPPSIIADEKRVFIVHGHNEDILNMVADYIKTIGLTPIILKRLARNGIDSILNQISQNANVMCAILLFTADDKGCEATERRTRKRARQNVVFEAGYFLGKLGREKVLMMSESNLELPSDLGGCRYINLDSKQHWKNELYEDLQSMGLEPDKIGF